MADTGKEIKRPDEPYMVRQDGIKLYKYISENGMYIIQHPTGDKYTDAVDVENATYTYTETDEPITPIEEPDETKLKSDAFDYLTGRSAANE